MEEKNIQLFPHNEEAYELLCKSIENYPLAFIEHATGTGKSFILLKYLYTKMRRKRILFISMHDEMFSQLFDDQMPSLGISKDEFHTFDTLIYHNILKYDMKDIIRNYDCIVFDEAHHCGAEKWSVKVKELSLDDEKILINLDQVYRNSIPYRMDYILENLPGIEEAIIKLAIQGTPIDSIRFKVYDHHDVLFSDEFIFNILNRYREKLPEEVIEKLNEKTTKKCSKTTFFLYLQDLTLYLYE